MWLEITCYSTSVLATWSENLGDFPMRNRNTIYFLLALRHLLAWRWTSNCQFSRSTPDVSHFQLAIGYKRQHIQTGSFFPLIPDGINRRFNSANTEIQHWTRSWASSILITYLKFLAVLRIWRKKQHARLTEEEENCSLILFPCDSASMIWRRIGDVEVKFYAFLILENTESLLEASREAGLERNTEKTKYMVTSHQQDVGKNHNLVLVANPLKMWQSSNILDNNNTWKLHSWRNWEQIKVGKCLLPTCSESSSRLISKNFKIQIHKTINLTVVLHGCGTWSLIPKVLRRRSEYLDIRWCCQRLEKVA